MFSIVFEVQERGSLLTSFILNTRREFRYCNEISESIPKQLIVVSRRNVLSSNLCILYVSE